MRNVIASLLAIGVIAGLSGCESSAQPGAQSILNYRVDEARGRSVWLTRQGVQIHSAAGRPVSVELPGWTYAGAPHCPPVVALGPAGEMLVTSNVVPTLWRIDPATLAVTVHPLTLARDQDKDIGFAALAYVPERGAYVAYSETLRSAWLVDANLTGAVRMAAWLDRPKSRGSCADLARLVAQPAID